MMIPAFAKNRARSKPAGLSSSNASASLTAMSRIVSSDAWTSFSVHVSRFESIYSISSARTSAVAVYALTDRMISSRGGT